MDSVPYLHRLGFDRAPAPSIEGLRALQGAHLERIPFENASVLRGEPIVLEAASLVAKIVEHGRGGFCFELNGAFAWLLGELGFDVTLLPGRFWSSSGLGPPYEHLALRVMLDGEPWLVDVGAGYSFREPLRLEVGLVQDDPTGRFRLAPALDEPDAIDVDWHHGDGGWRPHYRLENRSVGLGTFAEICEHLRSSPDSPFTRGWICARALPDGWATLDGSHLVVTRGTERIDKIVEGAALGTALKDWFGVPSV